MKILRTVALVADWIVGIAAGIAGVVWGFAGAFGYSLVSETGGAGVTGREYAAAIVVGAALAALNVIVVIDLVKSFYWAPYLVVESGGARMNISTRAIQDALRRAVLALDEVSSAHVRVLSPRKGGKAVLANAYVALKDNVVYHDISRSITSAMEGKFSEIVGGAISVECHIYWEKIKHGSKPPSERKKPFEVVRPQWPVDGSSEPT